MTFLSLKFLGVCVAADWSGRERLVSKVQAASGWSRYSLRAYLINRAQLTQPTQDRPPGRFHDEVMKIHKPDIAR